MSLISEALKEAQRERSERAGTRSPASISESFFPYPTETRKRTRSHHGFIIGASLVTVVAVGGTVTIRSLASRPSARAGAATTPASPTPATVVKQDSVAASVAKDSSISAPTATKTPPVAPQATASDRRIDSPATTVNGAESLDVKAKPESSGASPVTPIAKSSALRVVIDPASPRPGDSLFARAFAEHSRGNLDAAAGLYEDAIAHPPVAPELYNDYGVLLAGRGKHSAAITMYNLGLSANARDPRLWTNLGDSYRAVGRRADAMSAYYEAGKLDPSNIAVKLRLAGEYSAIGDTASARRGYEEAVRIAPSDPDAHYAFGSFLQAQRDYRGATRELQTFIDNASGRYAPDVIERTKTYVSNLRRQYP